MVEITLVGIGTGNTDHVTLEGRRAIAEAALILIPRKAAKDDLAHLRERIVAEADSRARIVHFDYPTRDERLPYQERVRVWHDEIAHRWQAAIGDEPAATLLVWGDPGLYDSTLRIAARLPDARTRVIPGITALQALTAAHAIPFNTVNGPVSVTTGRRLREHGWPDAAETVVVMLDGGCSFCTLPSDLHIWWGAYLGMPEQILDHGPLSEATPRIIAARAAARERHGWIMDTYLLRRPE
ncbi:precorrin-6A synthase (deacetylating) [Palleronia sp.]|uniref:precorrin-6A synthase (deacetylating) n=1 Tax=Palleronia sp. TaxID=1940284 RepID=UPI0035C7B061